MMVVGVTGGIGSGKTTVCQSFEALGVPVYYADVEAKQLYDRDLQLQEALKAQFGDDVYTERGLNRERLAQLVFNDQSKLAALNALVHPAVARDFEQWKSRQTASYVMKEAAILIETGGHQKVDQVLLVSAPEALRIQRVMTRDGVAEEAVRARMNNQWSDEQKRVHASHELVNDGSGDITDKVSILHQTFLNLSKNPSS